MSQSVTREERIELVCSYPESVCGGGGLGVPVVQSGVVRVALHDRARVQPEQGADAARGRCQPVVLGGRGDEPGGFGR